MKHLLATILLICMIATVTTQICGIRYLIKEEGYNKGLSDTTFLIVTVVAFLVVDVTCLKVLKDILNS